MDKLLHTLSFQSQNDANLQNLEMFLASKHFIELVVVVGAKGEMVDVLPLVTRAKENGEPIPNSTIYGARVHRIHRGECAIIADPVVGDIGFCIYCDRDTSLAFNAKKETAPPTTRNHSRMDAIYVGGVVNKSPTHYITLGDEGISITSPNPVVINTPVLKVSGDVIDNFGTQSATMSKMREVYNTHHHPVPNVQTGSSTVDTSKPTEAQ